MRKSRESPDIQKAMMSPAGGCLARRMAVDTAPACTATGKQVGHTPVKEEDSTWILPHGNKPALRYTPSNGYQGSVRAAGVNSSSWPRVLGMVPSLFTAWPVLSHRACGTNISGANLKGPLPCSLTFPSHSAVEMGFLKFSKGAGTLLFE